MASKKGCFIKLLKSCLVLLIVLIVLLVAMILLAIGDPVSYPASTFDSRDKGVMAGVITRLARSLVDKEGRVVETAELHLTQNEVQTLLNAMMRDDGANAPETVPYAAIWEDGRIRLFFSGSLRFGKAANLFIELTPYVDDGQLTIDPGSGSIGKLPMSQLAMDKMARRAEKEAMSREKVRTALSAFKRVEPGDDGGLILMFDPRDVNTVVRILKSAGEDPREAWDEEEDDEEDDENAGRGNEDADEDSDDIDGEIEERIEKIEE